MSEQTNPENLFFVAPPEAPPSRRPPLIEVGLLHWLHENLFKTATDSVISIIMGLVLLVLLGSFLNWALFQAQWEVDFLNLRPLNVGVQFPASEVWRISAITLIVIFLSLMSVGLWGRITRLVLAVLVALGVTIIVLPPLTSGVPSPPIHFWIESGYNIRQANFIGQKGQQVSFAIDPLTENTDYLISSVNGFIENDNRGSNTSFDAFTTAGTNVTFLETRDPTQYDLRVSVEVKNASGDLVYQSDFTDGAPVTSTFDWQVPEDGWYTLTAVLADNSGEQGAAWLIASGINPLIDTDVRTREVNAVYGPPPALSCGGCGTTIHRTDLRFQGRRSLAQWFSQELSPFLEELRGFFFQALVVGAAGFVLAWAAKRYRFQGLQSVLEAVKNPLRILSMALFVVYIVMQVFAPLIPASLLSQIYVPVLGAFCIVVILWALSFLLSGATSRGLTLLWLISFPIISLLLTGVSGSQVLPVLDTSRFGGLLLTLLLSAVAIGFSLPLGLLLALGRQSPLPAVTILCTVFIEVLRGVPLITLLFMGQLILPFFGFGLGDVDLVIRTMVMMTLFTSAYMAEVIRGGLQIVAKGQLEAAHALGLNEFYTTTYIVLPQALRAVIPAIMGQAVSLYKDTSLVFIIGLFEVLGVMNKVILADSQTGYTQFAREGYLYVGIVYFIFSYLMADVSRRLERTGSGAVRRETV